MATPETATPLVPARMLNEYAYCPRLAYLEWVQGEWEDNAETEEGRWVHRRVDRPTTKPEAPDRRSVALSSERLGLTAVIDLLESRGGSVRPVDTKRGKAPAVAGGAYEPERVQLCAQGLLLREHGYATEEGILYFAASRKRVRVRFSAALVARTLELLAEMRQRFASGQIPPPLDDSPKCPKCSLVRLCLPAEVSFLRGEAEAVRPMSVSDTDARPLVVQEPGARVRLDALCLVVEVPNGPAVSARLEETSQVVLMGGNHVTGPALRECCRRGIPILHLSGSGWFYGITHGMAHKNVELRVAQFAAAADPDQALVVARALVAAKIRNCRVLLRRNGKPGRRPLALLQGYAAAAERAAELPSLLGIEGNAARIYFANLSSAFKSKAWGGLFRLEERNRRPPRDPVNALLSFVYTLLTKDWTVAAYAVGLDPFLGLYHQPRYGKPALALDLMEPFRPVVADSVVLGVINNGEVRPKDFVISPEGVLLKPDARKRVVAAYERRLSSAVRHPVFGYRASYRRIFEIQARLLGRHLLGEIDHYPAFQVR